MTTTTVTVLDQSGTGDPYETGTVTTLATAVPAVISSPVGDENRLGGEREQVDAMAYVGAGAPELDRSCVLVDEQTTERWSVTWTRRRQGLGLDHQQAGLRAIKGAASG